MRACAHTYTLLRHAHEWTCSPPPNYNSAVDGLPFAESVGNRAGAAEDDDVSQLVLLRVRHRIIEATGFVLCCKAKPAGLYGLRSRVRHHSSEVIQGCKRGEALAELPWTCELLMASAPLQCKR
eukprot:1153245-Pelagomonas_calceolata.AAC.6